MVTGQKLRDNKPPRIFEEIIAKYAVDATLFQLGSTNPKKIIQPLVYFGLLYRGLIVGRAFDLEPPQSSFISHTL